MKVDILAVGAHPDDIELCCAGTLIRMIRGGRRAAIVDLTEGELGTRGSRTVRRREAAAAASIIGCARENLRIPDGGIDITSANLKKVIAAIRKYRPAMMFIPHWRERHPDHVRTHHLCREAWFYAGLRKIVTVDRGKRQEPWRPHNYFHYMQWFEFTPSFIVDISDSHDVRTKAIQAHRSQFHDPASREPETRLSQAGFLDFVETRAKYYGGKIGVRYGEPFYSIESVGISDPFELLLARG